MRERENGRNWTQTKVVTQFRLMVWRRKANSDGTEEQITQRISYGLSSLWPYFPMCTHMVNHYVWHVLLLKSNTQIHFVGLFMYVSASAQLIEVGPLVLSV